MNSNRIKIIIIGIFILIFGLLALPNFDITFLNKQIHFTKINLATILDKNSTLFNPRRSIGISSTKEYTAELTFVKDNKLTIDQKKQALQDTYNIIKKRINYSDLYDVKVQLYVSSDKYFIKVSFPEYYLESDILASTLLSKGEVTFFSQGDQASSLTPVNLKDSDIIGSINTSYETQLSTDQKDVLKFKFKESKVADLSQALSNSKKYFLMLVDNGTLAVISTGTTIVTQVEAVPLATIKDKSEIVTYLNIIKTYFLDKPLDNTLTLSSSNPKLVNPDYNPENTRFIVITFLLSLVGLIFLALIAYRRKGLIKFSLMILSYISFSIFLLKLPSAVISVYSILGFVFIYIIVAIIIWKLINVSENRLDLILNKYRDLGIYLAVILIIIYKINYNLGFLLDFIQVAIACLISFIFMCIFNFKLINTLNFKLSFKEKENV